MKRVFLILAALAAWTAAAATPNRTATEAYVTNKIAAAVAALPAPDYSTNNTELVETIQAKAPAPGDYAAVSNRAMSALQTYTETDPTISAWAKAATKPSYAWNEIASKPTFATVATSGSYNDLSNKPTIPTTAADVGALPVRYDGDNIEVSTNKRVSFFDDVYFNRDTYCVSGVVMGYGSGGIFPDSPNVFAFYFTGRTPGTYTNITSRLVPDGSNVVTSNLLGSAMSDIASTIPSTAADIGALPISGGTMTGNLEIGYNSLFQINGGGNAKFQFSWGSALDNLIISAYKETSGSYSIRFPTRAGLLALASDIPTSMAWGAITSKPTTLSGYGITDALKADFSTLTNNAAFTSAVAAVSPPVDLSGYCTTGEAAGIASNVVSQAYIRQKLGVYLYVGEDGGIYVHTEE